MKLSWKIATADPFDSDLLQLVSKRVDIIAGYENSLKDVWYSIFPENIGSRSSIEYVLENIIYRPRDILQLLVEFQKEFSRGKRLTIDKIQNALVRYSEDYFMLAMQDEITGFFPDSVVTQLPEVLTKIGSRVFSLGDFEDECDNYEAFESVSKRDILERLFNAGYIGQYRPRDRGDYVMFSYRNPIEKFIPEDECILHRGLTRALTI